MLMRSYKLSARRVLPLRRINDGISLEQLVLGQVMLVIHVIRTQLTEDAMHKLQHMRTLVINADSSDKILVDTKLTMHASSKLELWTFQVPTP